MLIDKDAAEWLTLTEVIRQARLSEPEVRQIIGRFGDFLSPRNFGDIVKYPPDAAAAVSLIANLYGKGWRTEEIMEALTPTSRKHGEFQDYQHLPEGSVLMLSSLELLRGLIANVTTLSAKLAAAMAEIKHLKEENRVLRRQLAPEENLQG